MSFQNLQVSRTCLHDEMYHWRAKETIILTTTFYFQAVVNLLQCHLQNDGIVHWWRHHLAVNYLKTLTNKAFKTIITVFIKRQIAKGYTRRWERRGGDRTKIKTNSYTKREKVGFLENVWRLGHETYLYCLFQLLVFHRTLYHYHHQ